MKFSKSEMFAYFQQLKGRPASAITPLVVDDTYLTSIFPPAVPTGPAPLLYGTFYINGTLSPDDSTSGLRALIGVTLITGAFVTCFDFTPSFGSSLLLEPMTGVPQSILSASSHDFQLPTDFSIFEQVECFADVIYITQSKIKISFIGYQIS